MCEACARPLLTRAPLLRVVNELYNALREIWDHDESRTKEVVEYYKYLLAKKPSTAPAEHLLKKVMDKMKVKKDGDGGATRPDENVAANDNVA